MYKKISHKCLVVWDFENPLFAAYNMIQDMIKGGFLDPIFNFPKILFPDPVANTIINRLEKDFFSDWFQIFVISKKNTYLLPKSIKGSSIVAKDPVYSGPGCQASDNEIRKLLYHILYTAPCETQVVLVGGDGGLIKSATQLSDKGHKVSIVSPEWTINRVYYDVIGSNNIFTLSSDWLAEVINQIISSLPLAN